MERVIIHFENLYQNGFKYILMHKKKYSSDVFLKKSHAAGAE